MAATRLLPMLGLAILILVGGVAASEAFETSAEERTLDEQFTPSVGLVTLSHSNLDNVSYYEQVRVRSNVSAGGGEEILAVEGTDYQWNPDNGTLTVLSGSRLADGGDANITYGYYAQSTFQRDMANVSALLLENAPWLVFIGVIGGITIALRVIAS